MTIDRFVGQHRFLSNFCPSPMAIFVLTDTDLAIEIRRISGLGQMDGLVVMADHEGGGYHVGVLTVEHGFQSDKAATAVEQLVVLRSDTAATAKSRGRRVRMRDDWEDVKLDVMRRWLRLKFSTPSFRDALIATGDAELIEGNTWHDTQWGCVQRGGAWVGENMLGKLLMEVRAEIVEKEYR
jgi:ribA/ribD-fused uncharacterized protein